MSLTILKGFCRTIDLLVMLAGKAAAYLMPILAGVVAFEVFSRYVLDRPTIWAYDVSLFLFGYITALGGAYAQQKRAHICVDILYLAVSHKTKSLFNLISYSLGIFFLIIMIDVSLDKLTEALEFNYRRQSEWAPPMFHFWLMLIIACCLFIAQLARDMLSEFYYLITGNVLLRYREDDTHGN